MAGTSKTAKTADKEAAPPAAAQHGRASALVDTRVIYCGDNLEQLAKLPPECVDLIYIDPPFNSNRNYEVFWGETKEKRSFEDRHASTQAYIDYMRPRCVELARVLKKTGSFYYHCDWHASHYVKCMLDQLFGENNFRNEIIWKRSDTHNDAKDQFPVVSDSIFYYAGDDAHFNPQHGEYAEKTLRNWYIYLELPDGTVRKMTKEERETQAIPSGARRFNSADMSAPAGGGMAAINKQTGKPNGWYVYKGYHPSEKGWRYNPETMAELDRKGLLLFPATTDGRIMRKRYLDEQAGPVVGNVWTDMAEVRANDVERLGYPTQKPLALLDRIINASSNPNDIVLDAFCGCGTALVAAQNLGRQWIGIDISPTACRVMAKRLRDVCKMRESEPGHRAHDANSFIVRDLPWTVAKLKTIPPFEFENWAVIALGGVPNVVQVGDHGIDGRIFPVGTKPSDQNSMFAGDWFPIQVKQAERTGRPDIQQFMGVMTNDDRKRGFFVSFDYSQEAHDEVAKFYKNTGRVVKLITVQEILDERHVQKM